jgi:hypothetical protein
MIGKHSQESSPRTRSQSSRDSAHHARASRAGRVLPHRVRLSWGQRGVGPGRAGHRCWSLGQLRSAASLPPPYQTGSPSLVVSSGRARAYPVTWPGFVTLYRLRTSTSAWSSLAKNSVALLAEAVAVETWRRRVSRAGSPRCWRSALPVSARVGRRAAVRSAGAVDRSP